MEIILAVAGVVIGVAVTHFSYRLSTRESSEQVDKIKTILLKLPDEVAIALKEDSRQQLTVPQLKEIVDAAYKCKDCGIGWLRWILESVVVIGGRKMFARSAVGQIITMVGRSKITPNTYKSSDCNG